MNEIMQNMSEELEKAIERLNYIEASLRPIGDLAYMGDVDANAAGAVMIMAADTIEKISEELDQLKDNCDKVKKGAAENE